MDNVLKFWEVYR